jgi:UDP-N-acetylglucosamine acyltransferase
MIHPTAIISPEAELAHDVEIGPYVCIEGAAKIGAGCQIQAHAVLTGAVVLGKNNVVGYGAIIGAPPQDLAFRSSTRSEVRIGDNNVIREYCTIHRGTAEESSTRIGNDNFFMTGAHIAHNCVVGNHVIIANNVLLAGHVQIQDRAFIGGGAGFHQRVRVGRLAMIQGNSGFSKDVPPFTIGTEVNWIAGLNVVGMRRAGFTAEARSDVKRAFKLLYNSGLNVTQAIEQARAEKWDVEAQSFLDFVASAPRHGICDLMKSRSSQRPSLAREEAAE